MALFGAKKTTKEDKISPAKTVAKVSTDKKEETSMQDLYSAPTSKVKTASGKTVVKSARLNMAYRVLARPVITEKATHLAAANKYVFSVAKQANKISVAMAIEAVYGVKPIQINIMNVSGKKVVRGKIKGQRNDWRKAIVTLKKGESIKIYEGV